MTRIFVLSDAQDGFFSTRKPNTNARALSAGVAKANIEVLHVALSPKRTSMELPTTPRLSMAKAHLPAKPRKETA
jgi:hypothetical protein